MRPPLQSVRRGWGLIHEQPPLLQGNICNVSRCYGLDTSSKDCRIPYCTCYQSLTHKHPLFLWTVPVYSTGDMSFRRLPSLIMYRLCERSIEILSESTCRLPYMFTNFTKKSLKKYFFFIYIHNVLHFLVIMHYCLFFHT
jgi:hypothetical protein